MSLRRRKYPSGKSTWVIDYRDPETGQKKLRTIGDVDRKTAELAWKTMQAVIAKAEFGIQSLAEQRKIRLSKLRDEVLTYSKNNLSPRTVQLNELVFRLALAHFGDCYLTEITTAKMEKWKEVMAETYHQTTIKINLARFKASLNLAVKWGYLASSPMKGVKLPPERDSRRVDFFSVDEIHSLLEYIDNKDTLFASYVRFLLYTGCRRNEGIFVEWSDINYRRGIITIRSKPEAGFYTKNRRPRDIPLSNKLRQVLEKIPKDSTYLFPSYQAGPHNLSAKFRACVKASGIKRRLTLHYLRHTFASHLAMQGRSLYIIAQLLGHSSVTQAEIYAHLLPSKLDSVVDGLPY